MRSLRTSIGVRSELVRFGGTVEKFIGDAVCGFFGAPRAHGDDAERAVRAALAVVDWIADLNEGDVEPALHVRVGVATGEALVALGARSGAGEGMAWGDVTTTAFRLQTAAPVRRRPRRRGDVPGDTPHDRLRRSGAGAGEGKDAAGPRVAGSRASRQTRRRPLTGGSRALRRPGAWSSSSFARASTGWAGSGHRSSSRSSGSRVSARAAWSSSSSAGSSSAQPSPRGVRPARPPTATGSRSGRSGDQLKDSAGHPRDRQSGRRFGQARLRRFARCSPSPAEPPSTRPTLTFACRAPGPRSRPRRPAPGHVRRLAALPGSGRTRAPRFVLILEDVRYQADDGLLDFVEYLLDSARDGARSSWSAAPVPTSSGARPGYRERAEPGGSFRRRWSLDRCRRQEERGRLIYGLSGRRDTEGGDDRDASAPAAGDPLYAVEYVRMLEGRPSSELRRPGDGPGDHRRAPRLALDEGRGVASGRSRGSAESSRRGAGHDRWPVGGVRRTAPARARPARSFWSAFVRRPWEESSGQVRAHTGPGRRVRRMPARAARRVPPAGDRSARGTEPGPQTEQDPGWDARAPLSGCLRAGPESGEQRHGRVERARPPDAARGRRTTSWGSTPSRQPQRASAQHSTYHQKEVPERQLLLLRLGQASYFANTGRGRHYLSDAERMLLEACDGGSAARPPRLSQISLISAASRSGSCSSRSYRAGARRRARALALEGRSAPSRLALFLGLAAERGRRSRLRGAQALVDAEALKLGELRRARSPRWRYAPGSRRMPRAPRGPAGRRSRRADRLVAQLAALRMLAESRGRPPQPRRVLQAAGRARRHARRLGHASHPLAQRRACRRVLWSGAFGRSSRAYTDSSRPGRRETPSFATSWKGSLHDMRGRFPFRPGGHRGRARRRRRGAQPGARLGRARCSRGAGLLHALAAAGDHDEASRLADELLAESRSKLYLRARGFLGRRSRLRAPASRP